MKDEDSLLPLMEGNLSSLPVDNHFLVLLCKVTMIGMKKCECICLLSLQKMLNLLQSFTVFKHDGLPAGRDLSHSLNEMYCHVQPAWLKLSLSLLFCM